MRRALLVIITLSCLAHDTTSSHLRHTPAFSKSDSLYKNLFRSTDTRTTSPSNVATTANPNHPKVQSIPIELPSIPAIPRFSKAAKTTLTPEEQDIPACVECEKQKLANLKAPALPVGPYFSNKNPVFSSKWGTHGHWKWLHHAGDGDIHHSGLLKRGVKVSRGKNYGTAGSYEKNMWTVKASMIIMSDDVPNIIRLSPLIAANTDVDRKYVSIRAVYRDNSGNVGGADGITSYTGPSVVSYDAPSDVQSDLRTAATGTGTPTATQKMIGKAEEGVVADSEMTAATASAATASAATASAATASAAPTATQKMIGKVVEGAVDNAKNEINGLIPKIEGEIENQEKDLNIKLTKAEMGLVGDATASAAPTVSTAQKMIGAVVERAVDNAKGEINKLIPQIEGEIESQEKDLEKQLQKAEEGLAAKDQDQHPDPEKEIESLGKTLDNLSNEVTQNTTTSPTTSLVEQYSREIVLSSIDKCVALEDSPGSVSKGKRYRSTKSSWIIERYEILKKTIIAASPFGPMLEPMFGGCTLNSIIQYAGFVLLPPCNKQCVPRKASKDSCVKFNERKCLTPKTIQDLKPQAAMAQSLLPPGTDIAMLFDVFDMITKCDDVEFFGGEATLESIPPLECEIATAPQPAGVSTESAPAELEANKENQESSISLAPAPVVSESQQIMGTVVEGAVNKAKGEIGSLIPKIEEKVIEQEATMQKELSKAEEGLTGEVNKENTGLSDQQKMMGTVVEGAVDKAKGEIGSLMPKIEEKIVEQENIMEGQLSKAEEGLVGKENKTAAPVIPTATAVAGGPTSAQQMMGTVVEGAVDKAKGEIGSLIPKIENKILEQENEMEGKLRKAEEELVNNKVSSVGAIDLANVNEDNVDVAASQMPTAAQKMMGNVVEGAVDKAKGQIASLIPKIEDKIVEQEEEMEGQLSKAEASLLLQTYIVDFVVHVESKEKAEDVAPTLSSKKVEQMIDQALGNQAQIIGIRTTDIKPPE